MPDMPHSFGCTVYSYCLASRHLFLLVKDFTLGVSVVILDGASLVQMLKGVEVSTVQRAVKERCF